MCDSSVNTSHKHEQRHQFVLQQWSNDIGEKWIFIVGLSKGFWRGNFQWLGQSLTVGTQLVSYFTLFDFHESVVDTRCHRVVFLKRILRRRRNTTSNEHSNPEIDTAFGCVIFGVGFDEINVLQNETSAWNDYLIAGPLMCLSIVQRLFEQRTIIGEILRDTEMLVKEVTSINGVFFPLKCQHLFANQCWKLSSHRFSQPSHRLHVKTSWKEKNEVGECVELLNKRWQRERM